MNECHHKGLCLSVLTLLTFTSSSSSLPSSSSSSSSSSPDASKLPCNESGCCNESNLGPGPLDLSKPSGVSDAVYEGNAVFLHHCLRYFTRSQWFRFRPGDDNYNNDDDDDDDDDGGGGVDVNDDSRLVSYPWGEGGRVGYLPGRRDNQTVLIRRVKRRDSGSYVFVASNRTHTVRGWFNLTVYCFEPRPSFSTYEQPVQTVSLGSQRTLSCAAHVEVCSGRSSTEHKVFWKWRNTTTTTTTTSSSTSSTSSGTSGRLLQNSSLRSVSVVCNVPGYFGRRCDVLISHFEQELFNVEFICKLRSTLNQTVRFVPIKTDVKTWLPYVLGVPMGAVVLVVLIGFTWWRYGHRIEFWCRGQRIKGDSEADAVILHGEDHEQLVKETLLPGVRALGHDILEEVTTPGRLELPDRLEAVETSHSVLLTFSAREMAEDAQVNFLARYVLSRKSRSTVLFIRSQHDDHDDDTDTTAAGPNAAKENSPRISEEDECAESVQQRDSRQHNNNTVDGTTPKRNPTRNGPRISEDDEENAENAQQRDSHVVGGTPSKKKNAARNPWNNDTIRSFRVLTLPRSLHPGKSSSSSSSPSSSSSTRAERSWREARNVEKFWYSLQKGLPKASRTGSRNSGSEGHRLRTNGGRVPSSRESHTPLIATSVSAERSGGSASEDGRRTNVGCVPSCRESHTPLMALGVSAERSGSGSSVTEASESGTFPSVNDVEALRSVTPTRDDGVFWKTLSPSAMVPDAIHAHPTSWDPPTRDSNDDGVFLKTPSPSTTESVVIHTHSCSLPPPPGTADPARVVDPINVAHNQSGNSLVAGVFRQHPHAEPDKEDHSPTQTPTTAPLMMMTAPPGAIITRCSEPSSYQGRLSTSRNQPSPCQKTLGRQVSTPVAEEEEKEVEEEEKRGRGDGGGSTQSLEEKDEGGKEKRGRRGRRRRRKRGRRRGRRRRKRGRRRGRRRRKGRRRGRRRRRGVAPCWRVRRAGTTPRGATHMKQSLPLLRDSRLFFSV
ncbi:uncharacterized protein LOC143275486 [Babylonia areolata]|uniref:uncharacterized protein LOC143275486 n=1 Tax=Babylonia areolata TaxID=304850 RepID=UPI003FD615CA